MKRLCVLTVISISLAGCAGPGWYKKGISEEETRTRLAQCKYNVSMNKVSQSEKEDIISDCMEGQGFRMR
jgi:hypothetical protein